MLRSKKAKEIIITHWPKINKYTWKIVYPGIFIQSTVGYTRKYNALRAARNKAFDFGLWIDTERSYTYKSRWGGK